MFARIKQIAGQEHIICCKLKLAAWYMRLNGDGSAREQAASCQRVIGGWRILPKSTRLNATVLNVINWDVTAADGGSANL
ncbi:hypothetical protein ACVXHA_14155 [Escherichia coli]